MDRGDFARAKLKAQQAEKLDVVWGVFEINPKFLLGRIDTLTNSTTIAPDRTPTPQDNLAAIHKADRRNVPLDN